MPGRFLRVRLCRCSFNDGYAGSSASSCLGQSLTVVTRQIRPMILSQAYDQDFGTMKAMLVQLQANYKAAALSFKTKLSALETKNEDDKRKVIKAHGQRLSSVLATNDVLREQVAICM